MEKIIDFFKAVFAIALLCVFDWYLINGLQKVDGIFIIIGLLFIILITGLILFLIGVIFKVFFNK
jgi:hypothetical protein